MREERRILQRKEGRGKWIFLIKLVHFIDKAEFVTFAQTGVDNLKIAVFSLSDNKRIFYLETCELKLFNKDMIVT